MASFSVLEPPAVPPRSFEAADHSAFIKDGFCWPALLFPPVWILWRRMWLVFLAWLAATVLISVGAVLLGASDGLAFWMQALFGLWFALEANGLRRWTLIRRGWRFAGIATGVDLVDAEHRFFGRAPAQPPAVPRHQAPAASTTAPAVAMPPPLPRGEGVIGMFPEPWDARR